MNTLTPESEEPSPVASFRVPLVISLLIGAALFALAAWARFRVPVGARIPIHWDAAGHPNGYGSRDTLFFLPGVVTAVALMFYWLPAIEPRRKNLMRSSRAYRVCWLAVVLFMASIDVFSVRAALGGSPSLSPLVLPVGVGLLFVVIGNLLGKVRSNFFFGVRTPWTLSSELSWNKTHRAAGWLFVTGGLGLIAVGLVGVPTTIVPMVIVGWAALVVLILMIYSYRVWRSDPNRQALTSR